MTTKGVVVIHKFFASSRTFFSAFFPKLCLPLLLLFASLLSANIAFGFDRSFAWDKNTESDIAGYYIYYKNGGSGPPYNGTGADEGDSPIQIPVASLNDPDNPQFTIHGLSGTGTFYFVATAYDTNDNESSYSTELSYQQSATDDNSVSSESAVTSGCFIATAAFGSKFEKHVQLLRRFRDLYLIPNSIGRAFVRAYYRYSPPVANYISHHNLLRILVRWSLIPLIGISWILLHFGLVPALLLLTLMSLSMLGFYGRLRSKGK